MPHPKATPDAVPPQELVTHVYDVLCEVYAARHEDSQGRKALRVFFDSRGTAFVTSERTDDVRTIKPR